jgi:orotidine-5'-phosphate decarboxylase
MAALGFRRWIAYASKKRKSRIVLAMDYTIENPRELVAKSRDTLRRVAPHICAVKFNKQLVLPLGLYTGVQELVDETHRLGLPAIMDCKLNDIGNTNHETARHYYRAGFDAVIANPFVGWKEGLEPVFRLARRLKKGVILLVYMSHKGAAEGYGQTVIDRKTNMARPQYLIFAENAIEWKADGVIVGGTCPQMILEVKTLLGEDVPIYSPGIGFQGGSIEQAIKARASYLIVGRSIILADNPEIPANKIREASNKYFSQI